MVKNKSHTLAYSLIALQEMNLAYKYPIIFWNTACLISDSGGAQTDSDEEEDSAPEMEEIESQVESFTEEDNDDEDDDSSEETTKKAKKPTKTTNYGKISAAIGKMKVAGITIAPPDVNKSLYTFSPDVENNVIRYGLSGITRVGDSVINSILSARPFKSMDDFLARVKVNKTQMINLIKSGAFDWLGERTKVMHQYVDLISDTKKRITLQNMKMLIDFDLIPEEYNLQKRVFNFNKYLKKAKNGDYYDLDNIAFNFYNSCFDIDMLSPSDTSESNFRVKQTVWDTIYKKQMDIVRPFVKANQDKLLTQVNDRLTYDTWNKYCLGSLSKWEMDSISCYIHPHELAPVSPERYGFSAFNELSNSPVIDRYIFIKGKQIPLFKLSRIYGTVLDRDKSKKTVTLLTPDNVVTVKIYGGVFSEYDKQLSEVGADGHKHVTRKSEFSRGNKIIVTGIKTGENEFLAKKYSRTPWHLIETIAEVDGAGAIKIDNRNDEET